MFGIGFPEMIVILVLVVLVVGPDELPNVVRKGVAFVREARNHLSQIREEVEKQTESLREPLQTIRGDVNEEGVHGEEVESERRKGQA